MAETPTLKRNLSWPLIFLYGLGTTIGVGIYALTGEVALFAIFSAGVIPRPCSA